jgi:hypothetical protein
MTRFSQESAAAFFRAFGAAALFSVGPTKKSDAVAAVLRSFC